MFSPEDIVSYREMCAEEGVNLQRGMNFRIKPDYSLVLMSVRRGAPYADQVEDDGQTLIYERDNDRADCAMEVGVSSAGSSG